MDLRRQSSLLREGSLLRVWGTCWAACLLAISTASGQNYGPAAGPAYGQPGQNSVYSAATPNSTFGPQAGYGMGGSGYGPAAYDPAMELPQPNGMQQPGELEQLNYSQSLGDYGTMQLHGSPTGDGGIGANYQARPATWLHVRDLQMGVYTNEEQTVINGGSTFEFFTNDRYGLGGRVLLGGVNNDTFDDEFHFTGDLYAGTTRMGDHWLKGGVLYDLQRNFHKVGPQAGALLFADRKHPLSLDFAYGFGYGDRVVNRVQSTILDVADDDVQFRAGTYLTPNLQVGFTGNWLNWEDERFDDYNGYGGFVNLNLGTLNINVDYTDGDGRARGFVNVAYTFGGRRSRTGEGSDRPLLVEHPRDWMTKPVMRDTSVQLQRISANLPPLTPPPPPTPPQPMGLVGNVSEVNFRLGAGSGGIDGVIDAGETFTVDVELVNNTSSTASTISAGNVSSSSNLGVVVGGANVVPVGTLLPGQRTNLNLPNQGTVAVPVTAQPGDTFFVDFDVTADGQTRRFRVPITVGGTNSAAGFMPTAPI